MDKRILIFSPELMDRERIEEFIDRYSKINFKENYGDIKIQKYSSFQEPPTANQLGHWGVRELFVVVDRRLCPNKKRFKKIHYTPYYRGLKASSELSKQLCVEMGIPYIEYEGEITKRQELKLIAKLDGVKDKIKDRLNKLEQETINSLSPNIS